MNTLIIIVNSVYLESKSDHYVVNSLFNCIIMEFNSYN